MNIRIPDPLALKSACFISFAVLAGCNGSGSGSSTQDTSDGDTGNISVWSATDGDYTPKLYISSGTSSDSSETLHLNVVNTADTLPQKKVLASNIEYFRSLSLTDSTDTLAAGVYYDTGSGQLMLQNATQSASASQALASFNQGSPVCSALATYPGQTVNEVIVHYQYRDSDNNCLEDNHFVSVAQWNDSESSLPVLKGITEVLTHESGQLLGVIQLEEGQLSLWTADLSSRQVIQDDAGHSMSVLGLYDDNVLLNITNEEHSALYTLNLNNAVLSSPTVLTASTDNENTPIAATYYADNQLWYSLSNQGISAVDMQTGSTELIYENSQICSESLSIVQERLQFTQCDISSASSVRASVTLDGSDWQATSSAGWGKNTILSTDDFSISKGASWSGAAPVHTAVKYTFSTDQSDITDNTLLLSATSDQNLVAIQQTEEGLARGSCAIEKGRLMVLDQNLQPIEHLATLDYPVTGKIMQNATAEQDSSGLVYGQLEYGSETCYDWSGDHYVFFYYSKALNSMVYVD